MKSDLHKFLERLGGEVKLGLQQAGKPVPRRIEDMFKVLSMFEITLGEVHQNPTVMERLERVLKMPVV